MTNTPTLPWDPAEHLETHEDMVSYLNLALEEGDLSLIMASATPPSPNCPSSQPTPSTWRLPPYPPSSLSTSIPTQ